MYCIVDIVITSVKCVCEKQLELQQVSLIPDSIAGSALIKFVSGKAKSRSGVHSTHTGESPRAYMASHRHAPVCCNGELPTGNLSSIYT